MTPHAAIARAAAAHFLFIFFLSLALLPGGDPRWIAAAAAGYFLARAATLRQAFPVLLVFVLLGLFRWGALIAGVSLFAAFIAESWSSSSRWRQASSSLAAAFCMLALLFAAIPSVSFYIDPIDVTAPQLLVAAAVLTLPALVALRVSPAAPTLDPLLVILLSALTLCYGLAVALLAASIAYPEAILLSAAGGCVMLVTIAVLTTPLRRDGTLDLLQHIFVLHVPIEKWVADISADAAREGSAAAFADAVMQRFLSLPGVGGARWRLDDLPESTIGAEQRQHVDLHCPPLFLRLYMRRRASPWDWFNYYLLARISGEYCRAKQREEQQRADNLSRALHTTGARLTHDIKNILHTLTALAQSGDEALMRRQLPALCDRLENTLAKLQAPDMTASSRMAAAGEWWQTARARHAHQPIIFADSDATGDVPADLFDLALDNFTANALIKRQTDSNIVITAQLLTANGKPTLRVQDSGTAVAAATAAVLFRQPVDSATGFGIALYQVQVEADKYNHRARLLENTAGRVVFELAPAPAANTDSAAPA